MFLNGKRYLQSHTTKNPLPLGMGSVNDEQCWLKAIEDGWRWDYQKGKFYRIIGN
jgi:hypothetical protein